MRVLALDAALGRCSVAVVADSTLLSVRYDSGDRSVAARLPLLADAALDEAGRDIDLVAVTIGPGSFTGVRAALSVAHGFALGAGCPIVGVSVGEALADSLPHLDGRALWVAIDSRRGHVLLERGKNVDSVSLTALPPANGRVAVAGDAAIDVAARLAARGDDVMLTDMRLPVPQHIASIGRRRWAGELPPRAAQPLYVDPPAIKLPAVPPRPPPSAQ